MQDTLQLILDQLRELNDNSRSTGERLASLETSMKSLLGNGQPGLISKLQDELKDLQRWRWRMAGLATGAGVISSGVISGLAWLLKQ